jgi:hypothetical protein
MSLLDFISTVNTITNVSTTIKIKEMFRHNNESKNSQLENLYKVNWEQLLLELNNDELDEWPAIPYLLKIDETEYEKAKLKIMFFGQETNGWGINDERVNKYNVSVEEVMQKYFDFCYNGGKEKHGGAFWNGVNRFTEIVKNKFNNKYVYPIYNNIIKIGKMDYKNRPPQDILELEQNYFNILLNEINILHPDILIFFTGPNYDDQIKSKLGDIFIYNTPIEDYNIRELVELKFNSNCYAFRTYHPNFLYRNDIEDYFESIINHIVFDK